MKVRKSILPVIVLAQFFCGSLWFAGNGVIDQLISEFELSSNAIGHMTSAVQLGFIVGTLTFAIFTIVDSFSPSTVFFICALSGALANIGLTWDDGNMSTMLVSRFMTGFFLAGIYPVGMKIAADYFKNTLGKSLGFLVGALVLGTALPHLFQGLLSSISWKAVLYATSFLSVFGGFIIYLFVPDGPFRSPSQKLNLSTCYTVFKNKNYRSAAFGYFGHMWELYAFWTFVPLIILHYNSIHGESLSISIYSFLIIGIGALGCIFGGAFAQKYGAKKIAILSLTFSGACCLLSPLLVYVGSPHLLVGIMLFWGFFVVADSPLFSTLVANSVVPNVKGTAIIIVTCIGFSITIVSIELLSYMIDDSSIYSVLFVLTIGPIFGVLNSLKINVVRPT